MLGCGGSDSQVTGGPFHSGGDPASGMNAPEQPADTLPYPAGPYGVDIGSTVQNVTFYGWNAPGAAGYDPAAVEQVTLARWFNPDASPGVPGTKTMTASDGSEVPVKIILINIGGLWCPPCRQENADIRDLGLYDEYSKKGVQILGVLIEDINGDPAKPKDIKTWGNMFDILFPLVADPGHKLGPFFTGDAIPMNIIVRASDMKVVNKILGLDTAGMFASIDDEL